MKDLQRYAASITSQNGEDGILREIFNRIGEGERWCLEFGAWDGQHLSNTYSLMSTGWSGVFIEGDEARYQDLLATYHNNPRAIPVCAFVTTEAPNDLDSILRRTVIPTTFDLLSVDIDGNDYHVWSAMDSYRARVVIIEFNPTMSPSVDFIQPDDGNITWGNSFRALNKLATSKGYKLAAATVLNAIFVRAEEFEKLDIQDPSMEDLFDYRYVTALFQLYDGTVVTQGNDMLCWHRLPLAIRQVLPKFLRVYPSRMNRVTWVIFRLIRKIYKIITQRR